MAGGGKLGEQGLSPQDMNLIQNALTGNVGMMDARYQQLGLGVPSTSNFGGDPATAAAQGGNLQWGGRSTANITDDIGLQTQANAALGQLQNQNAQNPAIAGTAANIAQNNQSLASLIGQNQSQTAFNQGAQSTRGNPIG